MSKDRASKPGSNHTLMWEDQKTAMLGKCGGEEFPPGNAPILTANQPIVCPKCKKTIKLVWNVFVKEISDEEAERYYEKNDKPRGDF